MYFGHIRDPHAFLGLHSLGEGKGFVVRGLDPYAEKVQMVNEITQEVLVLSKIHPLGFFEGTISKKKKSFSLFFSLH